MRLLRGGRPGAIGWNEPALSHMEEPVTASMWELAQDSDGCLRVELERTLAKQALTSANGTFSDLPRCPG